MLFYLYLFKFRVNIIYLFLFITNKIPEKGKYFALLQANIILSFLSKSFRTKITAIKYFFNLNYYQHFLQNIFLDEKRLVKLSHSIYPAFYDLSLIDKALEVGKGVIILNVHSFDHYALQLLLQKKYSNIYTIVMDKDVDYYLNRTKANTNNQFLYYKDKNLFMKLRNALNTNRIVIIHQDLFNMKGRSINVNFMGQIVPIIENIAAYLSYYTACPIISSYTYSVGTMFHKVRFANFEISKTDSMKEYSNLFHLKTAHYIESFVKQHPSQWMGWKYLKSQNIQIKAVDTHFFPDYIFFDKKQNYYVLCKLYPLQLIKLRSSKMNKNLILYFYKLIMNGIKNYNKKS